MTAIHLPPVARREPPRAPDASFESAAPGTRYGLDVLDGLVSISHQAWMRCPASSVMQ